MKKLTQKEFIKKVNIIHNNFYDLRIIIVMEIILI
jgi:hypothetical protein